MAAILPLAETVLLGAADGALRAVDNKKGRNTTLKQWSTYLEAGLVVAGGLAAMQPVHPASWEPMVVCRLIAQQITGLRQTAAQVVMQLLRQRGGNLQGKIICRDLQFSDLLAGTVRGVNSGTVSSTYVSLIANVTLPVNQAVAIFGIVLYDAAPTVDAIKFQLGGAQTMGWINIGPLQGDNRIARGYHEPVSWAPPESIHIQPSPSTP